MLRFKNDVNDAVLRLQSKLGKKFQPNPGRDLFIGSYPRSGNTWIRSVVFYLEYKESPKSLMELDYAVPDSHYPVLNKRMRASARYIVKTHLPFNSQYKQSLYIVRNPVRAMESFHRYLVMATKKTWDIHSFACDAVTGRIWPGSWSENVLSWTTISSNDSKIPIVRYEDLASGRSEAFKKVADFLELEVKQVSSAFKKFDIDYMKLLEKNGNRPGLSDNRNDWFIAGGASVDNQQIIREAITKLRPEIIDVASHFGYDML